MAEKKMQSGADLESLMNKNAFYQDSLSLIKLVVVVEIGAIIALAASIMITLGLYDVRYRYFPTTSTGEIVKISPLSEPGRSEAEILNWTAKTVPKLFTFGPHDYRTRISEASSYFTDSGHAGYVDEITDKYLNEVRQNKRLVVAAITSPPRMWNQRVDPRTGAHNWCVVVKVKVVLTGGDSRKAQNAQQHEFVLSTRITRVSALKSKEGIGISQLISTPTTVNPSNCWQS